MTKSYRWFLPLVVLITGQPIPQSASAAEVIFNGDKVPAGTTKYNYIVELTANSDTVCGGIAVGDRWVLTAAHCVPLAERVVPFGANQGTLISRRFCHPDYVRSTLSHLNAENDLALLKTQSPVGGSWQREDVATPNSTNLLVFGWGKTSFLGLVLGTSLRRSKPMLRQDARDASGVLECDNFWKDKGQVVDGREFCAGDSASSACNGDSGGPLFNTTLIGSELEPENLVGILSKADNDCNALGIFDIYTAIDSQWIEKIVNGDTVVQGQSTCP